MLNRLLIIILKHKLQKLVYKNCDACNNITGCYCCNIFYVTRDIKDVLHHAKEGKI
jgi:hypothetical protein|nr:MAG TPA: hypothetical protein [Caudoviricetes sp.]